MNLDRFKNLLNISIRGAKQYKEDKFSVWTQIELKDTAEQYLIDNKFIILKKHEYKNLFFFEVKLC